MVRANNSMGQTTYDIYGIGLGEGLMCCNIYEVVQLRDELNEIIKKEGGDVNVVN